MKKEPDKFEHITMKTFEWLRSIGYPKLTYPRWSFIRYQAKSSITSWNYGRQYRVFKNQKRLALLTICFQTFSVITGECGEWKDIYMVRESKRKKL